MLLDGNDPLIRDHFGLALKMAHANSRIVFRIRWRDDLLEQIAAGPAWLTVGRLARWFGCSKPTVRNYLRQGLLRARRRTRATERELIARESAHLLVQLCRKLDSDWWPQGLWAFSRIDKRLHQEGTGVEFARLGSVLTLQETAVLFRCSRSSVRRMIELGRLEAFRPTPGRWAVRKQDLPLIVR